MRHVYPTTVKSVGSGGVVGADGKILTCMGSLPVQPGDTIYTDGRVVYGHVPIRAQSLVIGLERLIPFYAKEEWEATFDNPYDVKSGGFTRTGKVQFHNKKLNKYLGYIDDMGWLYVEDNVIYGNLGLNDNMVLDMRCTDSVIYTAEFTGRNNPVFGKACSAGAIWGIPHCNAMNIYFQENNGVFTPYYPPNTGKVLDNPVFAIKANGATVLEFDLSNYTKALDTLKDIYLSYDESGEDIKRYRYKSTLDDEGATIFSYDMWCSYYLVQMLNFRFVDDNGNWEMIIACLVDGTMTPHTIDQEYNQDTQEYEDVYSYYHLTSRIIYYVMRVKSDGTTEILQKRIAVTSFANNGVTNPEWVNAASVDVQNVRDYSEPTFTVDFGDCSMTTDLRTINQITDSRGDVIVRDLPLYGFRRLWLSNPDAPEKAGATSSFWRIYLQDGTQEIVTISGTLRNHEILGADGSRGLATYQRSRFRIMRTYDGASYFGRLSIYQFSDSKYAICLNNQLLWICENGQAGIVAYCPNNQNLEITKINMTANSDNDIKTLSDLIATRTTS